MINVQVSVVVTCFNFQCTWIAICYTICTTYWAVVSCTKLWTRSYNKQEQLQVLEGCVVNRILKYISLEWWYLIWSSIMAITNHKQDWQDVSTDINMDHISKKLSGLDNMYSIQWTDMKGPTASVEWSSSDHAYFQWSSGHMSFYSNEKCCSRTTM